MATKKPRAQQREKTTTPRQLAGYWVDETIPDLSEAIPKEIDQAAFIKWFKPMLVQYRNRLIDATLLPTIAEELQWMKRFGVALREVEEMLRPGNFPLRSSAALATLAMNESVDWSGLRKRAWIDVLTISVFVEKLTRPDLEAPAAKRGAKGKGPRNELLAELVKKLSETPMKAYSARTTAKEILKLCGIETPRMQADDDRAMRRAEKKGQK